LIGFPGYGFAIILSLFAMAVVWLIFPVFGASSAAVLYVVVVLAAWRGGLGPGMLAMAFGVLIYLFRVLPPLGRPGPFGRRYPERRFVPRRFGGDCRALVFPRAGAVVHPFRPR
jgi:hypothetical protein